MKVKINNIEILDGKTYTCDMLKNNKPYINSDMVKKNELYTIIIVDPDAPYPSNPTKKYFLHLLVINSKETKVEYTEPNPPFNSPAHRYMILLFLQKEKITINDIENRSNFYLDIFIKKNNLKLVDKLTFLCKK